jgi:hypothetical protein
MRALSSSSLLALPAVLAIACAPTPSSEGEGDASEGEGDASEGEGEGDGEIPPLCAPCAPDNDSVRSQDCRPGEFCLALVTGETGCARDCSFEDTCVADFHCEAYSIDPPSAPLCGRETCARGTCSLSAAACVVDSDCPLGTAAGTCLESHGVAGYCADDVTPCASDDDCDGAPCELYACIGGDDGAPGACSCVRDGDCPNDQCEGASADAVVPVTGNCALAGHACTTDAQCPPLPCEAGRCVLARKCMPDSPASCLD